VILVIPGRIVSDSVISGRSFPCDVGDSGCVFFLTLRIPGRTFCDFADSGELFW